MIVVPLSKLTRIITDQDARPEEIEPFRAAGLEVIVANVEKSTITDVA